MPKIILAVLAGAVAMQAQNPSVTLNVDANANRHNINPNIYGLAYATTTQLSALTRLPPGAVSSHLRVLLEAGAVLRRRAGREVLYWRTSLGDTLAASPQGQARSR